MSFSTARSPTLTALDTEGTQVRASLITIRTHPSSLPLRARPPAPRPASAFVPGFAIMRPPLERLSFPFSTRCRHFQPVTAPTRCSPSPQCAPNISHRRGPCRSPYPGLCYSASTTRTVIDSHAHALPPLPSRDCTHASLPVATVCAFPPTPSRSLSIPVPHQQITLCRRTAGGKNTAIPPATRPVVGAS